MSVARLVATEMHEHAGVEPKLGKFQAWAKGEGVEPPGLEDFLSLRPDEARPRVPIWKGNLPAAQNGIVVLGTPIGQPEFVQLFLQQRLAVQDSFLHRLRQVPGTQAARLMLLYCAVPRANHLIRALPPEEFAAYASAHGHR